jgi:hypothetical protein
MRERMHRICRCDWLNDNEVAILFSLKCLFCRWAVYFKAYKSVSFYVPCRVIEFFLASTIYFVFRMSRIFCRNMMESLKIYMTQKFYVTRLVVVDWAGVCWVRYSAHLSLASCITNWFKSTRLCWMLLTTLSSILQWTILSFSLVVVSVFKVGIVHDEFCCLQYLSIVRNIRRQPFKH